MTDKRMHAFMDFVFTNFGVPLGAMKPERAQDLLDTWNAACNWCDQPPQPRPGALVLDGTFFTRK